MTQLHRLITRTVLLLAITMMAQAANPIFHMDDPGTGQPIPGLTFDFFSNQAGGGFFEFMNESGFNWLDLNIQVVQPTNTNINCTVGTFFSTCLVSPIASDTPLPPGFTLYNLNFSSILKTNGIANGDYFNINLNNLVNGTQPQDPAGLGEWGPNVHFTGQVNAYLPSSTPEPKTWALLIAGVVILGSTRYVRKRSAN